LFSRFIGVAIETLIETRIKRRRDDRCGPRTPLIQATDPKLSNHRRCSSINRTRRVSPSGLDTLQVRFHTGLPNHDDR